MTDSKDVDFSQLQGMNRSIINTPQQNNFQKPSRIFLHLDGIAQAPDGFEYAFGTDILNKEKVKIRLNTVDERVQDMIVTGRMRSKTQAIDVVKNQYENSAQPRKSLSERIRNNSAVLSFDQSYETQSNDNYRTYRAHWAESVTTKKDAQLIIAPTHVQFVNTSNPFGRVEILEKQFIVDKQSNTDDIRNMFISALNHEDEYSAERSGTLNYLLRSKDDGQSIFNGNLSTYLNPVQAGSRTIRVPADINTTLTKLMKDPIISQENRPQDNIIFNHDLNRIIVNKLLKQNFVHKLETSDPQLQMYLKTISAKLDKGELFLDAFTSRNIFLGKETVNSYRAKASRSQSPLKIYNVTEMDNNNQPVQHKGYLPTLIGVDRHSDTLSPFVTFTATTDPMSQAEKLEKVAPVDRNLSRSILLNEEFSKDSLPSYVKSAQNSARNEIENSKRSQSQQSDQNIDFGFHR